MARHILTEPPYTVECPTCGSDVGLACTGIYMGRMRDVAPHQARLELAAEPEDHHPGK